VKTWRLAPDTKSLCCSDRRQRIVGALLGAARIE
jgi:hypothetical protein